jgi:hypothetical protein
MSFVRSALALALLTASVAGQTLTLSTAGTVPRIPPVPFIPGCQTTPEPHYFAVSGTISQRPAANQEIRLLVRPYLLDGSTIPGCAWVSQCQRAFVLPDNSFVVIGQFGSDNVPRSWFSGQRADLQFALIDRNAGVPACIADPAAVSLAVSNVTTVNIDPTMPTLHDYQGRCGSNRMDVTGTPSPGNILQFVMPSPGAIVIGVHDFVGFPLSNCRVYLSFPLVPISTDAAGTLTLPIPNLTSLLGVDLGSQGVLAAGAAIDTTQPTLISIR